MPEKNKNPEYTKLGGFFTFEGILLTKYFGETSFIISFKNLNLPTSVWNEGPHDFTQASKTANACNASLSCGLWILWARSLQAKAGASPEILT